MDVKILIQNSWTLYFVDGVPDAGDGVQHNTGESNEDAHQDEAFIVGAEGIIHVTCTLDVRKYFEHRKIFYQLLVARPA